MMDKVKYLLFIISLCLLSNSLHAEQSKNTDLEDLLQYELPVQVELGSRDGAKNALKSRSPTDVITRQQIEHSGIISLTNLLRYFIAGFNAPETSVADGSDHVRAFTLRGMAPDQVLVLLNGKRLHSAALLHVNGTIGRGSSGVDLDVIAVEAIDRIEVLRDGAAAQYGSDAIAGVVNIILKSGGHDNAIKMHAGTRLKNDGAQGYLSAFMSSDLQYDGFANVSISADKLQKTQRAGVDLRLTPARVSTHVGMPDTINYRATVNAEMPLRNGVVPYITAIFNQRSSKASAFYRPASTASSPIFPQGFLPEIQADILDYSFNGGFKGQWGNTFWDISNTFGSNKMDLGVNQSMNYSLGAVSPTSFKNGTLKFSQYVANVDLHTDIADTSVAGGLEFKHENYAILAGDQASYVVSNNVANVKGGSQGFSGFRPENQVSRVRNNYALYGDVNRMLNQNLSLEGAVRFEHFADFGNTTNAKLSASYQLNSIWMLRGGVSTGFRAPSLSQNSFSQVSSFVDATTGNLTNQGTFRTDQAVALALGAKPLKAENSKHLTLGSVLTISDDISLTVDYFYAQVNNRITLTPDLAGVTAAEKAVLAAANVSKARFFTNGLDTETQGVDIKLDSHFIMPNDDGLDVRLWFNYNKNKVLRTNGRVMANLDNTARVMLERGQPRSSWRILSDYQHGKVNIAWNNSYYGSYQEVKEAQTHRFSGGIISDLDISYKFSKGMNIAIGGNNIFNTQASRWKTLTATSAKPFYGANGIKPYSRYSPYGYSGAYYYIRSSFYF